MDFEYSMWLKYIIRTKSMGNQYFKQWRRQRNKGARSFRGQNILKPGHPDALFSAKKLTTFLVVALETQSPPTPLRLFHCQNKTKRSVVRYGKFFSVHTNTETKQSNRQGRARAGTRAVDLLARSFDLARPGVAPPLISKYL